MLFLRFFVPALISPVELGLLPQGSLTPSLSAQLRHITSAIQCIANQTSFGAGKAAAPLNDLLIEPNREAVGLYLQRVWESDLQQESPAVGAVTLESCDANLFVVVLACYVCCPTLLSDE